MTIHRAPARRQQQGATLVVALIMLALITLLVVNAFTLSSSNLKAVGNLQARSEALAAANQAIERAIVGSFYTATTTQEWKLDINKDGTNDFTVVTSVPSCIRTAQAGAAYPSDVELGGAMSAGSSWNVDWEIEASVTDVLTGRRTSIARSPSKIRGKNSAPRVAPGATVAMAMRSDTKTVIRGLRIAKARTGS